MDLSVKITPYNERSLFTRVEDGELWDTSLSTPSRHSSPKKEFATSPTIRKTVGNVAFITSLEQIAGIESPRKKKEMSPEPSPKLREISPSPVEITPQTLYKMEDQLHDADRETRKMGREVDQMQSDLAQLEFNIINQNKFTKNLIMDTIIDIQKNLRKHIKEDANTNVFMQG